MEWILEADVPTFPLLLAQVGPDTVSSWDLLCRLLLWDMERVMKSQTNLVVSPSSAM